MGRYLSSLLLYSALQLAAFCVCQLVVNTTNGLVEGHRAGHGSTVVEFLGVPYAQPPLGQLRFAPPRPYSGNSSYKASNWGFSCPQTPSPPTSFPHLTPQAQRILNDFAGSASIPQDEDCLTLNIWTASTGPQHLKPVLIFFYGGRFTIGNTHSPFYNGQDLANYEDVVVVTVNYRVNIFGFPGGPHTEQNLGLRDQRLAVEWLRDNILAFGGNSSKLTIFGQSSGGVAVDYWSYAFVEDPIVHALISESGTALSFPLPDASTQQANWYNVSGTVGCGTSGDTTACMRQKPWKQIEEAAASLPPSPGGSPVRSIPPFYPKVDETIVFSDYLSRAKSGKFARLPYLLGNNNHEQGYYVIPAYDHGINVTKKQGNQFLLSSFTCPNAFEAKQRIKHNVPAYLYRYFGDWKNIRLYPGSGAYHGTDLEMVFGNSGKVSGIRPTGAEVQTTRLMQHAWVQFADDPLDGLRRLGWPPYDPEKATLAKIAYNNVPDIQLVKPSIYDAACSSVVLGALT